MRIALISVVAIWSFMAPIVANAGGEEQAQTGPYQLVMSQNDQVCQHMLGLINDDISSIGKIDYSKHEEFSRVAWETVDYRNDCNFSEYSLFDLNNDGSDEFVVRVSGCLSGVLSHDLYAYTISGNDTVQHLKAQKLKYTKVKPDSFETTLALGERKPIFQTKITGSSYPLQRLPMIQRKEQFGGGMRPQIGIGGTCGLHPLGFAWGLPGGRTESTD